MPRNARSVKDEINNIFMESGFVHIGKNENAIP